MSRFELGVEHLVDYARGAAFLGTGGGGDPYLGRLATEQELKLGRQIDIIELEDLADDALVAKVGSIGSPSVGLEKLMSAGIAAEAIERLQRHIGRPVDAVISGEIGGNNATIPLIVSAQTGMPVVNADGMGRAFPMSNMSAFSIHGCQAAPAVALNNAGDCAILDIPDNLNMERAMRSLTTSMGGGRLTAASFLMTGAQVKACAVPKTLKLAYDIGHAIGQAKTQGTDPYDALASHFSSAGNKRHFVVLFDGKIADIERTVSGGFTFGRVQLRGRRDENADPGTARDEMEISFQNENLAAYKNGQLIATVPDLITILDRETAEPITTEKLKYGQRVKVIGLSCTSYFRTQKALSVCGPRAFGIEQDYKPIEELLRTPTTQMISENA